MPRKAAPIPTITAVPRDLGLEDARLIIETVEREEQRRIALIESLRVALDSNDTQELVRVARQLVELEGTV